MDIGSIFLILALMILVALFVTHPFITRNSRVVTSAEHEISSLLAEREGILRALQELDFDYALQKIPEEEYPQQRQALLLRGAEILRRLDALQPTQGQETASTEDRLEAAIAARRRTIKGEDANDPLEAAIAARRRARSEKAAGFCAQCGTPLQRGDKFCPRCGTPVTG